MLLAACAHAPSRPDGGDPYAGPPPGAPAVRFAPGVIPEGRAFAAALTPDARTLVFTYSVRAERVLELWTTRFENGRWTPPRQAPFARGFRAADPFLSRDGRRLYFSWDRPRPGMAADTSVDFDTWVVERTASGAWGEARHVGDAAHSPASDMYPGVARDGTLYFDSMRPGLPARRNVWRARLVNGAYGAAEPLPREINDSTAGASNPYVDPDERYIIFTSARAGSVGTNADLWISYRKPDGSWGEPRNLGPRVNTPASEFCPTVSPDGRWLLFSRIRSENGQPVADDVYIVGIDVLPPPG